MISTKGRYSIRVLLDLAEHRSGDFIPMKEVAARQDISLKYIERVTCLQPDAPVCQRAGECRTLGVWQGFYKLTRDYFTHITLADLMNAPAGDNYVI